MRNNVTQSFLMRRHIVLDMFGAETIDYCHKRGVAAALAIGILGTCARLIELRLGRNKTSTAVDPPLKQSYMAVARLGHDFF